MRASVVRRRDWARWKRMYSAAASASWAAMASTICRCSRQHLLAAQVGAGRGSAPGPSPSSRASAPPARPAGAGTARCRLASAMAMWKPTSSPRAGLACGEGIVQARRSPGDPAQLVAGAPGGREPRRLALDGHARLVAAQIARRPPTGSANSVQAGRRPHADEGPGTLARIDQAIDLQPHQRLAHHRPRGAEHLRDLGLGRQPAAFRQLACRRSASAAGRRGRRRAASAGPA